jgi:predicted regulator of Ras-like GTPase activity (Roadblock/LC7/MglB family)
MSDDISRWSDELARDPSSLVFLQLGEALRRRGQLEVALKIAMRGLDRHARNVEAHDLVARIAVDRRDFARAFDEWETVLRIDPRHVGAMKGLGYVAFHQGRIEDAEHYLTKAAAGGAGPEVRSALETLRRSALDGGAAPIPMPAPNAPSSASDPQYLFADVLPDEDQTALLLDPSGLVMAGVYLDADGNDVSSEIGARLSGISDEVRRSTRHLDIGAWKAITFETHAAVVAMAPTADDHLIVLAASRATPLGVLRRLLDRCAALAADWIAGAGDRR